MQKNDDQIKKRDLRHAFSFHTAPLPHRCAAHDLELLQAFSFEHLRCVDIALGVDGDVVHAEEEARAAANRVDDLAIGTPHQPHLLIGAVDHQEETLLAVGPQIEIPGGAG